MAQVPTMKVKRLSDDEEVIINTTDMDASLYEKLEDGDEGDKQEDFLRRVRSATTTEDLDRLQAEVDTDPEKRKAAKAARDSGEQAEESDQDKTVREEIATRRKAVSLEKGPKYIQPAPPQASLTQVAPVEYVPYLAPASPGVALRTHGVDPVAHQEMAKGLRGNAPPAGQPESKAALDDTRNPKNLGTDPGAIGYGVKAPKEADPKAQAKAAKVVDSTVDEVTEAVAKVKTVDELDAIQKAEAAGKDRVSVREAIERRRAELAQQ